MYRILMDETMLVDGECGYGGTTRNIPVFDSDQCHSFYDCIIVSIGPYEFRHEQSSPSGNPATVNPRKVGSFASDSYTTTATNPIEEFRRFRTLVGILTANTRPDYTYRRRHRHLFQVWNDTRVCSLRDLRQMPALKRNQCQLVYTFVIGAATDPKSPPLLVILPLTFHYSKSAFPSKSPRCPWFRRDFAQYQVRTVSCIIKVSH